MSKNDSRRILFFVLVGNRFLRTSINVITIPHRISQLLIKFFSNDRILKKYRNFLQKLITDTK